MLIKNALQFFGPIGAMNFTGVNYNEHPELHDKTTVEDLGSQLVRFFIPMHKVKDDIRKDSYVEHLLEMHEQGFSTILNLKWDYKTRNFPEPGSRGMNEVLQQLDDLLEVIMGKADILVIGNEPFIESKDDQKNEKLVDFYKAMYQRVVDYRKGHKETAALTRLFTGAFNQLYEKKGRSPGVEKLLRFTRNNPDIDGIDLHPHTSNLKEQKEMVEYATSFLRDDQTFIVTEFSLVHHWTAHSEDTVRCCGKLEGSKVFEALDAQMKNPVPIETWTFFLKKMPWYTEYRDFLTEAVNYYKSTGKFTAATYAYNTMLEWDKPLTASQPLWLLNSLKAPPTVKVESGERRPDNWPWAEQFRRLTASQPRSFRQKG